jgi:LPS-assembly protein
VNSNQRLFYVSNAKPVAQLLKFAGLAGCLLGLAGAASAETLCDSTLIPTPALIESPGEGITIEADSAELGKTGGAKLRGNVRVSMLNQQIAADAIDVTDGNQQLNASGNVRFRSNQAELDASSAEISAASLEATFKDAEFRLYDSEGKFSARGSASSLETGKKGQAELNDVLFTTCPPGEKGWELSAQRIELNEETGSGYARKVKLNFYGVPLFYFPGLSFPYTDARKSGILAPKFASSGSSGLDISVPYYWNIAPNYDATLTPRILSKRGLMLDTEWRYLMKERNSDGLSVDHQSGVVLGSILPSDREVNSDRYRLRWEHSQAHGTADDYWSVAGNGTQISDADYFDDLGSDLATANKPLLHDSVIATLSRRNLRQQQIDTQWKLSIASSRFQVLQPTVTSDTTRSLPTVKATWENHISDGNLYLGGSARWDRFIRTNDDGDRYHFEQYIAWRHQQPAWYARAKLNLKHTRYSLENPTVGADQLRRSIPTFTAHLGSHWEKIGNKGVQIIEPSLHILYVPLRNQTDLPFYDTALPEFTWPWLFADNRYTGIDRIGDSKRAALSVRWQWLRDGNPLAEFRFGQLYEQSTRRFSLAGESVLNQRSGVLMESQLRFGKGWRFVGDGEWDGGDNEVERARANLIYQNDRLGQLSASWKQRQKLYEQVGFEYRRAISSRWKITTGMDYSLRDDAALETYALFRYQSCCWAVEMGGRRYVTPSDNLADRELDTAVFFRFELQGLGEFGDTLDNPFDETSNSWRY